MLKVNLGVLPVTHLDWYLSQSFSNHLKHFALKIGGNPPFYLGKHLVVIFFYSVFMQIPVPSGTVCNGFKVESA